MIACEARDVGTKHDVTASTVQGVWAAVEEATGIEQSRLSVIFKGKKLVDGSQSLSDAGVGDGDTVNLVAARKSGTGDAKEGEEGGKT